MITPHDEPFLRRALRLAMNGRGHVEPNPMVGCVLVKNGQTIGEGWHERFGGPHAEPNALDDCSRRGDEPAGATAYVTLEPCCHTAKKTPPCAPRLIEAKIARVVIGCLDPNPDVNGHGVAMLRSAGIAVDVLGGTGFQPVSSAVQEEKTQVRNLCHVDASHFQQLIAPFATRYTRGRYFTAKWAETADARVSGPKGVRLAISNAASTRVVHELRTRSDAIVVGIGTVLSDDPMLTPRGVDVIRVPDRFVLDSDLRLPLDCALVRTAREVPTTAICNFRGDRLFAARAEALRRLGVTVDNEVPVHDDGLDLYEALQMGDVHNHRRTHVLIEPGPTLARSTLDWMDRIWVIRSSTIRSPHGRPAPSVPDHFTRTGTLDLAGDTLTEYLRINSPAFFAAVPSADFVLAAEVHGGSRIA